MSAPVRVLQIEDNQGDVALVRTALREAGEDGFALEHAPRLEVGLDMLATGPFDIVLLDLGLPDSRGLQTFTRAHGAAPDVPIIVFSGLDDQDLALRAVQEGAQEYLVKGAFDGALLARAIRYAIGRASAERALRETERRFRDDLERQVRERTAELERTHMRLRIADRLSAIGTLAAGLGHDMNNVLLPVRCRLDALTAMQLPAPATEQLEGIRRSADYLQKLADGLRLLALDPEDAQASDESTSIEAWWQQVGPLLGKAVQKPIRLEASITPGLPPVAVAEHRLTQAVLNLIVNSAEAVQERVASGADAYVRLIASLTASGRITVSVQDNGRGMTEEVRRRAIEPFFTTKTRGLGTGLGLALVRGVVGETGGALHIESTPGVGTTISLELPCARQRAAPDAAGTAAITIDDPRSAAAVEMLLREAGYTTRREKVADRAPQADVWVVDGNSPAPDSAAAFVGEGGALAVVGNEFPRAVPAAVHIKDPFDLEAGREAVRSLRAKSARRP
jgi:signal transduction histidine kinase